jgi:hypothetical protein
MILLAEVYFYSSAYSGIYAQKEQSFDLSMARIAVREEINTIPYLKDKSISVKKVALSLAVRVVRLWDKLFHLTLFELLMVYQCQKKLNFHMKPKFNHTVRNSISIAMRYNGSSYKG